MNRRRYSFAAAVTAAVTVVAMNVAIPDAADAAPPTPGAIASASAAGTGSATLNANLQLTGSLGGLLDGLISPIVSSALNPLLGAVQGQVNTIVASTLGASSGYTVGTPTSQSSNAPGTYPNETTPSPCSRTSTTQPCYTAASASISAAPLVNASVGLVTGWTQEVQSSTDSTNPIYGRARVGSVSVSALTGIVGLTNPVVSSGLIDAKANCPNDGANGASKPKTAPSASISASSVTLLGGLVTLNVLSGQIASLVVNGVGYASLLSLPTVKVSGGLITVQPFGNSVEVSVSLSPTQLLNALGLANSVVAQLLGYSPTSSVQLSVIVGPGSSVTNKSASAWGLGIGVDLSGALSFNLLGLVTANLNIPSGVTSSNNGNLLDLRLAYATCQSGTVKANTGAVPPALV